MAWAAPVNAASIYASCDSEVVSDDEKFVCQIRSGDGKKMRDLSVEVDEVGSVDNFKAIPYSWVTNQSAFYFLVQTSSVSSGQLASMFDFLNRIVYPAGKQKMGFATAGASFDEKAPLGSSRLRIDNAIRAIRSMTPKLDEPSVVLASIEKAIVKLAGEEAERRAVVVISDSDPSTSGVSESKIADLARDNQVALYLVSFGRNKQEPSVVLKKLGRDSRGGTHDVTDLPRQQLLEFASELSTHLENGFILSFDARGLPQASEIRLSANLDGVGQASADPITVERQTEDSWIDAGRSFVSDNLFMLLAALGLGVGGIFVLRSLGAKNRSARFADSHGAPDEVAGIDDHEYTGEATIVGNSFPDADGRKPKAWLEIVGDHGERVPLHSGNIQVGRSKDSDIRLENSSVHRQHAMIQMDADGSFSIHDLGTKNGVFVNGARCSQRTLANGDLIELGEVKLRFADVPA
ncbi:MAG: hypothetical protein APF80_07050 [Alphaproteobacteria bacterium BRH_c36]|nr:MAG: hypothetical protein APF80_07050 [Alphaproteobacteria bacterium BRH_c36]